MDPQAGALWIPIRIEVRDELLEYLLVGAAGATHESLFSTEVPGSVLNTAFLSVYSGKTFAQARADHGFWGHLVESCIGAHLLNSASDGMQVAYWRESPHEVDFVVYQGEQVAALEVKSTTHDLSARKGLRAFSEKHPKQTVRTEVLGGNDFALAEALTLPASHWLPEW